MSAAFRHLCHDMQRKALQAETLLSAASCFIADDKRAHLQAELMEYAEQICCEIGQALDMVNLPKD